ncbi:UNVERIFIED_CONTAM: hypothetical protein FKN15_041850 [Acipenser sinensis]
MEEDVNEPIFVQKLAISSTKASKYMAYSPSFQQHCIRSWIKENIRKKECKYYVENTAGEFSGKEICMCGYRKASHSEEAVKHEELVGETWDLKRHVSEEPTDAYGDITFTGSGQNVGKMKSIPTMAVSSTETEVKYFSARTKRKEICMCGYRKASHSEEAVKHEEFLGETWDPKRHVSEEPTDAYGDITFTGSGQNVGKFVRVSSDTKPDTLYKLMRDHWGLNVPNLLISVTGGAKNFNMKPRLKNMFRRGLIKVARSTAFFITAESLPRKEICMCGYRKASHSEEAVKHEEFLGETWDPKRHVSEEPTDAYGDITFTGSGQNVGKFVRVSSDTKPDTLYKLMRDHWGLNVPNLLISVTGGAKNFNMKPRLKNMFRRGLIKVARSTGAWIVTGGSHAGVMKHVGEAVRDYTMSSSSKDGKIVAIGIATWGIVHNRKCLVSSEVFHLVHLIWDDPIINYRSSQTAASKSLDNQGKENWDHQLKLAVAWNRVDIAKSEIFTDDKQWKSIDLSDVMLAALLGDKPDFVKLFLENGVHLKEFLTEKRLLALYNNLPPTSLLRAWIVTGGSHAGVMKHVGEAVRDYTMSSSSKDGKIVAIGIATWGIVHNRKCLVSSEGKFPAEYTLDEESQGRLSCLDTSHSHFILVDNGTHGKYSVEIALRGKLEKLIYEQTLGSTASKSLDNQGKENWDHQLKLAVAWNRVDIAKSEIFTDDKQWKSIDLSDVMLAALLGDKPDFVKLFLENGVHLKEFLTEKRLLALYNNLPPTSLFLRRILKKQEEEKLYMKKPRTSSSWSIQLYHVSDVLCDLLGGITKPLYPRPRDRSTHAVPIPYIRINGKFPAEYTLDEESQGRLSCLDTSHSHFILVDNGTHGKYSVEIALRGKLEKLIYEQTLGSTDNGIKIPVVCVVLEGGPGTLNTIYSAMMNGTPCVVMEGSGRVADVIAQVANLPLSEITISHIQKQLKTYFAEDFKTFSDIKILEWTKKVRHNGSIPLGCEVTAVEWTTAISDSGHSENAAAFDVVMEGSGRVADVIAQVANLPLSEITISHIQKQLKTYFAEDFKTFSDIKILEWTKKIQDIVRMQQLLTVFQLEKEDQNDVDVAIIQALLKASKSLDNQGKENWDHQLKLAVAWNRVDIAKSEIFTDDKQWKSIDLSDVMLAALLGDKPDFVKLFLENGVHLKEFLTEKRLLALYNNLPPTSLFLRRILKKQEEEKLYVKKPRTSSSWSIQLYHVSDVLCDLLGGITKPLYPRPRDRSTHAVPIPYIRINSQDCIATALAASKILKELAKEDTDLSEDMGALAEQYEKQAIGGIDSIPWDEEGLGTGYCKPIPAMSQYLIPGKFPAEYTLDEESQGRLSCLDTNHSHFILVDNGTHGKYGAEIALRGKLEKFICEQTLGSTDNGIKIPVVCVVLEGGPGTLDTIYSAMMNGTPCVVMEGSGRVADVIAQVANLPLSEITISHIQKQLKTYFAEDFKTFSDIKILEWTKKSIDLSDVMLAALLGDKPDFVKLFLENGVHLKEFLTEKRLLALYNNLPPTSLFLRRILKKQEEEKLYVKKPRTSSSWSIQLYHVSDVLCDLLGGITKPLYPRPRDRSTHAVPIPYIRINSQDCIATALAASKILKELAKEDTDLSEDMGALAEQYEKQAIDNGIKIPVVCVVLEGGPGTLDTIYSAMMNGTPCVVMEGSGRVADVIAQVANLPLSEITISHIQKQLKTYFAEDFKTFSDIKILEWTKKSIDLSDVMLAALLGDKPDFVKLFLENGVHLKEFLTEKRLLALYNNLPPTSLFLRRILKKQEEEKLYVKKPRTSSSWSIQLYHVSDVLCDLLGGITKPLYPRPRDRSTHAVPIPYIRINSQDCIATALAASKILKELAKEDTDLSEDMGELLQSNTRNKPLVECHRRDELRAQKLLTRESGAWGNTTCLRLAVEANNKNFVAQGGVQTIYSAMMNGTPCVVMEGSGRVADVIAQVANLPLSEITISHIQKQLKTYFAEDFKTFSDIKILEWTKKIQDIVRMQQLLTVFRLEKEDQNDVDVAIIQALLKASKSLDNQGKENWDHQLKLAVAWNRVDIAKSEIFTDDKQWKSIDLSDVMLAALLGDKPDFVKLFLENGVHLKEFLTEKRLLALYNNLPPTSLFLRRILKKQEEEKLYVKKPRTSSSWSIQLYHVSDVLCDLLGGITKPLYPRPRDRSTHAVPIPYIRINLGSNDLESFQNSIPMDTKGSIVELLDPTRDLFIWAILENRKEIADIIWQLSQDCIATALAASKILKELAKEDTDLSEDMGALAEQYEKQAIECHRRDELRAQKLLTRESGAWGNTTCLRLAVEANNKNFVAQGGVQVQFCSSHGAVRLDWRITVTAWNTS